MVRFHLALLLMADETKGQLQEWCHCERHRIKLGICAKWQRGRFGKCAGLENRLSEMACGFKSYRCRWVSLPEKPLSPRSGMLLRTVTRLAGISWILLLSIILRGRTPVGGISEPLNRTRYIKTWGAHAPAFPVTGAEHMGNVSDAQLKCQ